jgi:hypothetical protein
VAAPLDDAWAKPQRLLEEPESALQAIAASPPPQLQSAAVAVRPYNPNLVYILARPVQDGYGPLLSAGTAVVDCSLSRGWLQFFVNSNDAESVQVMRTEQLANQAQHALHQIASDWPQEPLYRLSERTPDSLPQPERPVFAGTATSHRTSAMP